MTVIAQGAEALKRVAGVLPNAFPLVTKDQWGTDVRIEPGTVWGGDRMFVSDVGGQVVYVVGDKLYMQGSADFVRDGYLMAIGTGAKKAEWLIPIAQAEMAFVMAFVGAVVGPAATVAAITTGIGKIAVLYTKHKTDFNTASQNVKPLFESLGFLFVQCPKLMMLFTKAIGTNSIKAMPGGISGADVAYYLGKTLGGVSKLPEISISAVLAIAAKALAVTVAVRGPGMVGHGMPNHAKELAQELMRNGINVSENDAAIVLSEQCLKNPQVQAKLKEVATNSEKLLPVIERLRNAMRIEQAI